MSRTLSALAIGPGSIWKPSRGPSSWMWTRRGRSGMGNLLGGWQAVVGVVRAQARRRPGVAGTHAVDGERQGGEPEILAGYGLQHAQRLHLGMRQRFRHRVHR